MSDLMEFDGLVHIKTVSRHRRKLDGHVFRKYSGVARVDGSPVAVSFGEEDTDLWTNTGAVVSAPNIYEFPQTKLAPRLDAAGQHATIPGSDIKCYNLVEDSLLTPSPIQRGRLHAAMPVDDRATQHVSETE